MITSAEIKNRAVAPLLLALVVAGVALSCSTACLTSAAIGSASLAVEEAKYAREQREKISHALESRLPQAQTRGARNRLEVSGSPTGFQTKATGDFTPATAEAFFTAARGIFGREVNFASSLEILVYNDAQHPPTLVGKFTINPKSDLDAVLRPQLAAPLRPDANDAFRLRVTPSGRDRIVVSAWGDFTPETAKAFAGIAARWREAFPYPPTIDVVIRGRQQSGSNRNEIGRFTFPPEPPP